MIATFVILCAGVAALRTAWFWQQSHPKLDPDTSLYVQGGLGLFPSPLGRAIGALGLPVLAYLNIAAGAACVLLVALIATRLGGNAALAAFLALITPLAYWTIFAGVDTIATALLLGAVLLAIPTDSSSSRASGARAGTPSSWSSSALSLAAIATHLAVVPIVLARIPRPVLFAGVGLTSVLVLAVTPYGGNLAIFGHPWLGARCAVLTLLLAGIPFLPWAFRFADATALRLFVPVAIGTAAAAFLVGSERLSSCRYALPLTFVMCAIAATPRRVQT